MRSIQSHLLAGARIILLRDSDPRPCFVPLRRERPVAVLVAPLPKDSEGKLRMFARVATALGTLGADGCAFLIDGFLGDGGDVRPAEDPTAVDALICSYVNAHEADMAFQVYRRDDAGQISFEDPVAGESWGWGVDVIRDGINRNSGVGQVAEANLEVWLRSLGWAVQFYGERKK